MAEQLLQTFQRRRADMRTGFRGLDQV